MTKYVVPESNFATLLDLIGFDIRALTFSMFEQEPVTKKDERTTIHEIVLKCSELLGEETGNDKFATISTGMVKSHIEWLENFKFIKEAGLKFVEIGGLRIEKYEKNLDCWSVTQLGKIYQSMTIYLTNTLGNLGLSYRDIFLFGRKQTPYYTVAETLLQLREGEINLDKLANKICTELNISKDNFRVHLERLYSLHLINYIKERNTKILYWDSTNIVLTENGRVLSDALYYASEIVSKNLIESQTLNMDSAEKLLKRYVALKP